MLERTGRVPIVSVLLLAACCAREPSSLTAPPGGALVRFVGGAIAAEVADSAPEWTRGLMHRTSLGADAGMLFLFGAPHRTGFWMKDTLVPLSVAYLAGSGPGRYRVLALRDMSPCRAEPCRVYAPGAEYTAALEVNRGWFVAHGVRRGSVAVVGR